MISYFAFVFALAALMAPQADGLGLVLPTAVSRNLLISPVYDLAGQQHGFWAVAHSTTDKIKSRLEFLFTTFLFPRFRNRFFQTDNSSSTFYKFRIGLIRIIEFNDTTGNGFTSYSQAGNIVRSWSLIDVGTKFTPTTIVPIMIGTVKAYQVTTSLTNAEGTTVTLTAALSESTVRDTLRNRQLNPNAVKFNVDFTNVVYHSPISKIAIIASLDAISALVYIPNTNTPVDSTVTEDELDVGTAGRVTWVNKVTTTAINSTTGSVPIKYAILGTDQMNWASNATINAMDIDYDAAELRTIVAFTFNINTQPQPTAYSWDPNTQTGDGQTTSSGTKTKTTLFSFFFFLSILVAVFA